MFLSEKWRFLTKEHFLGTPSIRHKTYIQVSYIVKNLRTRPTHLTSCWAKGRVQKKKILEFSRFGLKHQPTLLIAENLEKINKIFIVLKRFLGNFGKIYFFTLENAKTLRKILNLTLTECFLSHSVWLTWCMAHGRQNARCGRHYTWYGQHNVVGRLT